MKLYMNINGNWICMGYVREFSPTPMEGVTITGRCFLGKDFGIRIDADDEGWLKVE